MNWVKDGGFTVFGSYLLVTFLAVSQKLYGQIAWGFDWNNQKNSRYKMAVTDFG